MDLVQTLPPGPLDIVGDVHGELSALLELLSHLGYDRSGNHPEGRKLVFLGDLCDRGPDSPGVIDLVRQMTHQKNAQCILGNHELNLLTNDVKDGSGWYFDERYERDLNFYAPFRRLPPERRDEVKEFLSCLPIALQRDDLRVVHAAWTGQAINLLSNAGVGTMTEQYEHWESIAQAHAEQTGLFQRYLQEKKKWSAELEDERHQPPLLQAIAQYEATQQMVNPFKVLTSGVEETASHPFFAGNRWRFSDRVSWWDDYEEATPVLIGHYWRLFHAQPRQTTPRYSQLFHGLCPTAWHGKHRNVFCIDFSVGARWRDRAVGRSPSESRFSLAAMRWPEKALVFDSGLTLETR